MRGGRLRHRVELQKPIGGANTYGEQQPSYELVATVWAGIEPLRGQTFIEARMAGAEVTTRIVLRWRKGVLPSWRVVWDEEGTNGEKHTYEIESVIRPDERDRTIELMCREVLEQ